ncbi:uncharacterized protein BKA78DRAFT_327221 [Phyllosticta capitalensis]|uniref:uncharacterized protein n=1 Tax=Phyllosticta capitalensis TaxID=121624 RepID=UPI00312CEC9E
MSTLPWNWPKTDRLNDFECKINVDAFSSSRLSAKIRFFLYSKGVYSLSCSSLLHKNGIFPAWNSETRPKLPTPLVREGSVHRVPIRISHHNLILRVLLTDHPNRLNDLQRARHEKVFPMSRRTELELRKSCQCSMRKGIIARRDARHWERDRGPLSIPAAWNLTTVRPL